MDPSKIYQRERINHMKIIGKHRRMLDPREAVAVRSTYLCNVQDNPIDGWREYRVSDAEEAVSAYYSEFPYKLERVVRIFVLGPGENPGVDKPVRCVVNDGVIQILIWEE